MTRHISVAQYIRRAELKATKIREPIARLRFLQYMQTNGPRGAVDYFDQRMIDVQREISATYHG